MVEERAAALDNVLAEEPRDERWAAEMEGQIVEAILSAELPRGDLVSIECRRSLCRTEVGYDSFEEREQALPMILSAGAFSSRGSIRLFEDSPAMLVYITRESSLLPQ